MPQGRGIAKVKAFTMMEVAVSMAITAIVISMSYTIYAIISKGYINFNRQSDEFATLIQLDNLLKRDFSEASLLVLIPGGLLVQKDSNRVMYVFKEDAVIRKSSIRDTFKVIALQKSYLFEGLPVNNALENINVGKITLDTLALERSRIDELKLLVRFREENIPYTYYKRYSSTNLMQRKAHAFH